MLIAHAPAGYILSKLVSRKFFKDSKLYILAGVFGSIACDLDIIYWEVFDNRSVNHHEYWTHIPHELLPLIPLSIIFFFVNRRLSITSAFFTVGVYLHLVLDTFLAGIKWHYPHSNEYTSLVDPKKIPELITYNETFYTINILGFTYDLDGWVYNLAMHWTFQIEIAIAIVSFFTFIFFNFKDKFSNQDVS